MKIKNTSKALAMILGLAVAAGSAQMASAATTIPLANAGFEVDDVPANNAALTTPAGWTLAATGATLGFVGDGGWMAGSGVAGAHSGDQYFLAYTGDNASFTVIRQDTGLLWSSLSAGDALTVAAWTTYRSDLSGDATVHFWLNDVNGSGIFSPATNATVGAAAGVWTQRSWTHTVTQQNIDAAATNSWGAVNVQIGILGGEGDKQTLFDDVSLVYTAIPEPSGIALCGLGIGLFALRRKRCL